jgi:guanosine-3',5'-bis(diphosphate) 3'-pyrophosphohydrolase
MTPTEEQARAFAVAAHGEQRYGAHPYAHHLDAVAAIARPYGEAAVVAAYLHDTVEDTRATLAEVESQFGAHMAACVALLTDAPGTDRKERKAKTYAKLAQVGGSLEIALVVKVADRLANVRACVHDSNERLLQVYRGEHEVFRRAAYRPALCEPLWHELDALLA